MENPELNSPAPAEPEQLQAKLDALNHLVVSVLILVLIMSGTLTVFLLRQWSLTRKDLAAFRPEATRVIVEFNSNKERAARMDGFLSRLTEYGRTHTNFVPILLKYGINPAAPAAAPPAPAAPAGAGAKKK